ncbi:receptor tyrosine-protein kinase erbB-4-like isoform X2 [Corticium candelabrum]|uniref:receptor tyrosine-protein kinase erbB-4-like isoform X2 n=1 Tax=Corticium candelabrum TaxID=121492 RepID=UPI002E267E8A|nr:receptor tyrosine-protein kinase erbB-4-like isoform X2 [Corticium candelabrum]
MEWSKKEVFSTILDMAKDGYEASSWFDSCCFVALRNQNDKKIMQAWIYNDTDNEIRLLELPSIIPRSLMSFVSVNKTSAILFGGRNSNSVLNATFDDAWIIQLQPMFKWKQADGDVAHSVRPSARFNHAATVMQSKMYVFGGMNASEECLNDVWVFDVNTERWSELTADNIGPNFSNSSECYCSAASTPGQLLITVESIDLDTSSGFAYNIERFQTWLFIVQAKTWHLIAETKFVDISKHKTSLPKSFFWRGFLLMLDTLKRRIFYLTVRCPAGFTSSNISEISCHFCKKGYYRETIASDPECVQCPNGVTTISTGARNIEECSMCSIDRCKYGKCVPDFNEGSMRPACQCFVGFTGSTCQYPTYWLIGAGIILVVALVSSGATAYLLLLNRKRKNERALQNEVTVLTNVWEIDEDEVMTGELIGSGASGSVYKAFYRNITVAVKKMVAVGFSKSVEDFETEIMFMRTVRHKNIVLFIGAGKLQPGDVPFLVMEYMERGSLRNVLYDLSIDINCKRKIKFAMDSARGMYFLHTLEPPRIHRDLKSDNLLVSKDWIVKVADFGLGRTVNGNFKRNDKQRIRRQIGSNPQHISLLHKREGLSFAGVGTARWRAPEFTLREPYGTAVDVYSFGIVLWEIWTRQLPFDQYSFDYEVTDAVVAKQRPVIPQDCPQPLASIMKYCWSPRPSDRLSFSQIISQLKCL